MKAQSPCVLHSVLTHGHLFERECVFVALGLGVALLGNISVFGRLFVATVNCVLALINARFVPHIQIALLSQRHLHQVVGIVLSRVPIDGREARRCVFSAATLSRASHAISSWSVVEVGVGSGLLIGG